MTMQEITNYLDNKINSNENIVQFIRRRNTRVLEIV